jgi:uncharacterized protein (TIGR00299 family) protein
MGTSRILYIDASSGISGDMTVGALLDLGGDQRVLQEGLASLSLSGYALSARKVSRAGIQATKFDVVLDGTADEPGHHSESHGAGHHPHRSFAEIRNMIESSPLSAWVRDKSVSAFSKLAQAEGTVHNEPPEAVHFHEVGAVDSIIDIVGCMILMELLMPAHIVCSPVNLGRGRVECRHGIYPVPAPAVEHLLCGVPTFSNRVEGELTTPTGAALLATLAESYGPRPLMSVLRAGYGAGARDTPGSANVLRLTLAEEERASAHAEPGDVIVIEAAIDDMSPQVWGYFQERALAAGALDVYAVPALMKKNRPGHVLTLLCEDAHLDDMARLIFAETTTIGLRYTTARRRTLDRRIVQVQTEHGTVSIKVAALDGKPVNFVPEFEDCRRLAAEKGVPLKDVIAAANRAYLNAGSY